MRALAALFVALSLGGCAADNGSSATTTSEPRADLAQLTLTSPAFADGATIPRAHTCDGTNHSPPLAWGGVPPETRELVLTVEDPDAPNGTFVHWLLYKIDPGVASLGEGPVGEGANGTNSFGKRAYGGPCPPKGTQHRYNFTLTAVSRPTNLGAGASANQLRAATPGESLLARGRLTGIYSR